MEFGGGVYKWLIIQNIIIWNYQNGSEYYDIKVANTNNKIIDEKFYCAQRRHRDAVVPVCGKSYHRAACFTAA